MIDVVTIGAINVDLITTLNRRPAAGETVLGRSFLRRSGGKAANQAAAAARAGAKVALIGVVGGDPEGRAQRDELATLNVDTTAVLVAQHDLTGVALITVTPDGENAIVVVPGANAALHPQHITASLLALEPRIIVGQTEVAHVCIDAAAAYARPNAVRFILNDAPVTELADATLTCADPLIVNEHEAAQLNADQPGNHQPTETTQLAELTRQRSGARTVVVTAGARGAALATPGRTSTVPAARPDRILDTTGAGDAFIGTLAAALATNADLEDAVRSASHAAAKVVAVHGSRPSPV